MIEQRRKRREAIKSKYRGSATPLLVQALQLGDKTEDSTPAQEDSNTSSARSGKHNGPPIRFSSNGFFVASPAVSAPATPTELQDIPSPTAFTIADDQELANTNGVSAASNEDDGPSAADYDPTADMREDKKRDVQRHSDEVSSSAYDETKTTTEQDVLLPVQVPAEDETVKAPREFDMFADDDDDMFAEEPVANGKPSKVSEDSAKAVPIPMAKELDVGMLDNWDDSEGYYKIILGELLNGRYHVQANLGKGMFSGVVRAMDVTTKRLVAIKLIRNNETMLVCPQDTKRIF